jgi:hypothetical protein
VAVILAVIPPGTTRKTGGDQTDGTADLTSENDTRRHPLDGAEATHNRSVAGSKPASPTELVKGLRVLLCLLAILLARDWWCR